MHLDESVLLDRPTTLVKVLIDEYLAGVVYVIPWVFGVAFTLIGG